MAKKSDDCKNTGRKEAGTKSPAPSPSPNEGLILAALAKALKVDATKLTPTTFVAVKEPAKGGLTGIELWTLMEDLEARFPGIRGKINEINSVKPLTVEGVTKMVLSALNPS